MTCEHCPLENSRENLLEASNLSKRFKSRGTLKTALDNVTFCVPRGSLTVILGPAGAGKTTALRLLAGLEKEDAGSIVLDGLNMSGVEPRARDVAMIFDNLALYPNKTGFGNMASPLRERRLPAQEIERRVRDVAAKLRILHILDRLPGTMSGGERQRVAMGRVLVRSPRLFLLDEPLSSLDAPLRIELRAEIKRLQREQGHTFLMATPDFSEAMAIADTVILLREGQVLQTAAPQELYDCPVDSEAARFVGAPQINILPAFYNEGRVRTAGISFPVPDRIALTVANLPLEGFLLGLRPENIRLESVTSTVNDGWAKIIDVEAMGLRRSITIEQQGAHIRVLTDALRGEDFSIGQRVVWRPVDTERLLVFSRKGGKNLLRPNTA